ncbi:MAG: (2Fe-2S)-binding protein [Deltaproteobacteria bacterium]|nr:(2Fe-2S)-binding protein [Deltaproteobacteria bacterium]
MKHDIKLTVNGDTYSLAVDPWRTLNQVLREDLNLTGTKLGCGSGDCGACTVILEGRSVSSCLTLAVEADGKKIMTVEGLAPSGEELHPIQEAFIEKGAIQCGFCTPGMELSAYHLLSKNPRPTDEQIREGLSGNLCRCTGYNKIVEAIAASAETMNRKSKKRKKR